MPRRRRILNLPLLALIGVIALLAAPFVRRAEPAAEVAPRRGEAARIDALLGQWPVLREALQAGCFGAAYAALETLPAGEMRRLGRQVIDESLARATVRFDQALAQARVVELARELRAAACPERSEVAQALRPFLQAHALPFPEPVAATAKLSPPGLVFVRERAVRYCEQGEWRQGRVVGVHGTEVMLKVSDRDGLTYPTVAASQLEPVDATRREAVALAAAAAAAGDEFVAALWRAVAARRSG